MPAEQDIYYCFQMIDEPYDVFTKRHNDVQWKESVNRYGNLYLTHKFESETEEEYFFRLRRDAKEITMMNGKHRLAGEPYCYYLDRLKTYYPAGFEYIKNQLVAYSEKLKDIFNDLQEAGFVLEYYPDDPPILLSSLSDFYLYREIVQPILIKHIYANKIKDVDFVFIIENGISKEYIFEHREAWINHIKTLNYDTNPIVMGTMVGCYCKAMKPHIRKKDALLKEYIDLALSSEVRAVSHLFTGHLIYEIRKLNRPRVLEMIEQVKHDPQLAWIFENRREKKKKP